MREVCVPCGIEMRIETVGVAVLEMATFSGRVGPYKLWMADLMKCPRCGHETVTRYADRPIAEHYQADFEKRLAETRAECRVIVVDERI